MDYEKQINELLKSNMSKQGFKCWLVLKNKLPNIWNKPTSSTGKYHKKNDGSIPSICHHTFEMLYSGSKIMRAYNIKKNSTDADTLLLSITLHDSMKYGKDGKKIHTDNKHDKLIADSLEKNIHIFKSFLTNEQANSLVECVRYHSGRWSTDTNINKFCFNDRTPLAHLVHMLDMLSTADCLKIPE